MKVLAVYGSSHGQAQAVLQRVAAVLVRDGHDVCLYKGDVIPARVAVADFGAIIVAASIITGKHQVYVRDFVRRNIAVLRARPAAFISVNGTSPESAPQWRAEARRYVEEFLTQTAWRPLWTASFAGALRYTRYGLVTRWIMRMISRRHGGPTDTSRDHEFTDWQAVDRFAEAVARGLAPACAVAATPP